MNKKKEGKLADGGNRERLVLSICKPLVHLGVQLAKLFFYGRTLNCRNKMITFTSKQT